MLKMDNHLGKIEVSGSYFTRLVGQAVSECFGVVGMAGRTASQQLRSAMQGSFQDKGVLVRFEKNGGLAIDLHICVLYGVNIAAVVKSIVQKVTYTVEAACGLRIEKVDVYVAAMKTP